MLTELAVPGRTYLATPPAFRRHVPEALGYWWRGETRRKAWAPHMSNARGLIDTGIDDLTSRRTVVVLGSGPLFDIPLESLARNFARVVLVDRVHPASIRPRVARYRNVEISHRDLAATAGDEPLAFLDAIGDLDWVISANLLGALAAAATDGIAGRAVDGHLDRLAALACPATLIADLDYRVVNRHGVVRESGDLLHGRAVPRTGLRWKWEVAPFGAEHRHLRRVHSVAAWHDWRQA
jgi:hypothetical protein